MSNKVQNPGLRWWWWWLKGSAAVLAWCGLVWSASATLLSSFQAGDAGWQMGTLGIGKLLGTSDLQIVIPYRDSNGAWYLDAFTFRGQRLPGFPYYAGGDVMNVSPTLYDLDNDGRDEIIFTRGNHVIALRGNGSLIWSNTVNSADYVPMGGYQTVTNGFYWSATGAFIKHLPSTAVFSSEVSSPMVVDLNGKGTNEIITAWKIDPDPGGAAQDYNPFISRIWGGGEWGTVGETWSGGVVSFNPNNGRQTFVYHIHQLVESGIAVGKANFGKPLNVYVLNDSDSVVAFDKSQPFGLWGKGMLHKQFGKSQRLMTGSYEAPIDVYTADLNGDGLDECLVAGTQLSPLWQPNETILDNDGAVLWRRWLPQVAFTNNYGWLNSACLIPVNPDHDNHVDVLGFNHSYEITFRYWDGAELVDRPGWPKNFYPYLPTPPVVGDVDGDGEEEIIIGTYNPSATPSDGNLLIYALDGTLKQSVPVPGGLKHIPALSDVEGLGRTDVIYRSLNGIVYVQNFGATGTNHISWATHRGNMHRDGNQGISLYPPGTPVVTVKVSGYNRTSFVWSNSTPASFYRIYRAEQAAGPFLQIAAVTSGTSSYTDYGLKPGWQYFYEVGAVYSTNTVLSAPFAILSFFNSNLVANAGFEQNDNSHWDKWWDGSLSMTNMSASSNVAYEGRQSMQVLFQNQGSDNSIGQFNQYGIPDSTLYVTPGAFYSFGGYFKSGGLTQPSEHWLQWTSTKTAYDTNNRPALPYPYYFTPHFVVGTTQSDWAYVNRTFELPSGFPNIELSHSFSVTAPASGSVFLDNCFFREIPAPTSTNWTTLVPFGSSWRYFTNTPPANWFATDFADSSWPLGTAKFGAGSGPTNVTTRLPQFMPAYYFRKQFTLSSTDFEEFLLSATCTGDSGTALYPIRVFLNGVEIKTTIDTVTSQGNEIHYFDLTPFLPLLRARTNTVAVILSNWWSSWDDVAFDVRLQAVAYRPVRTRLSVQVATLAEPQLSVEASPGTIWQLESSDKLFPANWQPVQAITNTPGGVQTVWDTGQGDRLAPTNVGCRFYRLVPY